MLVEYTPSEDSYLLWFLLLKPYKLYRCDGLLRLGSKGPLYLLQRAVGLVRWNQGSDEKEKEGEKQKEQENNKWGQEINIQDGARTIGIGKFS